MTCLKIKASAIARSGGTILKIPGITFTAVSSKSIPEKTSLYFPELGIESNVSNEPLVKFNFISSEKSSLKIFNVT